MAKKWHNKNLPGALHFVTGNTLDRKPIFQQEKYCRAFLEVVQLLRVEYSCRIIAFVLMLDHFHLIANPRDGDIQTATGILKSLSARSIVEIAPADWFQNGDHNQIWQESFKALPLWSGWMINQKINYIHANPVKANLCRSAEDYPWTSFRSFYREETDPLLAVDKDWWWEDDHEKLTESMKQWEEEKRLKLIETIEKNKKEHKG